MFPRPIFNTPFQTFAANLQPFNAGAGFGGMVPLQPQMGAFGVTPSINPLLNPLAATLFAVNHPLINPLAASPFAVNNPVLWPNLTPQPGIGIGAYSGFAPQQAYGGGFGVNPYQVWPALGIPQTPFSTAYGAGLGLAVNPLTGAHFAAGIPQINQLVGGEAAPLACDPVTGLPIAQPLNVLSQQRLPIRPLINTQQFDPAQVNTFGAPGVFPGQAIDPYSPLSQVQWLSQMAPNPIQQMVRAHTYAPWLGTPTITNQAFPFIQPGLGIY